MENVTGNTASVKAEDPLFGKSVRGTLCYQDETRPAGATFSHTIVHRQTHVQRCHLLPKLGTHRYTMKNTQMYVNVCSKWAT